MKPDAAQLYRIYQGWRAAVEDVIDVEGLYPTFVMNIIPKSSASVAKNNGVGNTWGMDDNESLISKISSLTSYNYHQGQEDANATQSGSSPPAGQMPSTTSG